MAGIKRAASGDGRKRDSVRRPLKKYRRTSLKDDIEEIKMLEARISHGAPAPGSNPLACDLTKQPEDGSTGARRTGKGLVLETDEAHRPYAGVKLFADLPISDRTMRGLKEAKYVSMTAIQRAALPHALCGRDVLGAAKTGSGKTLAFVIPVLEKLYRLRWSSADGVGAIVISPTRELAMQIFNELKRAGKHHALSGGLLIGGQKDVDLQKERIGALNILVATPGRLLQHMDETPSFDCGQLQMLVLDEADRILDLGFAAALNAILANIPKQRQTLLFSATQTKSVKDLARLSLRDPEYLAVHSESRDATPSRLQQSVMLVPLHHKLDVLWSFLKTHLRAKVLVFLSSCKQVKFVYEAFRRLRPGVPLKCLHGRMKQMPRLAVFYDFCEAQHAVLFATDVAARGLDFPSVDWVIQVDCPDDVASYIHRVGRTARFTASGKSLLFLAPSEQAMLPALEASKVPFKLIKANPNKVQALAPALAGLLSKDPELKYMAQRAFVTYLRSVHLQGNKEVFNVASLPHEEYAASLGLPNAPRIRFQKKGQKKLAEDEAAKDRAQGVEPRRQRAQTVSHPDGGGTEGGDAAAPGRGKEGHGEVAVGGDIRSQGGIGHSEEKEGRGRGERGEHVHDTALRGPRNGDVAALESVVPTLVLGKGTVGAKRLEGEGEPEAPRNLDAQKKRSKLERLFGRKNKDVLSAAYESLRASSPEPAGDRLSNGEELGRGSSKAPVGADDEEDFLKVKRANHPLEDAVGDKHGVVSLESLTARRKKKLKIKVEGSAANRLIFDEEGVALPPLAALARERNPEGEGEANSTAAASEHFRKVHATMRKRDREDRLAEKQRLREKRLKMKQKAHARSGDAAGGGGVVVTLGQRVDEAEGEAPDAEPGDDGSVWDAEGVGLRGPAVSNGRRKQDLQHDHHRTEKSQSEDTLVPHNTAEALEERRRIRRRDIDKLSLVEQEALVAKVLASQA